MKITSKALFASLFAMTLGFASVPAMAKTVPVKFKTGASGATYSNKIKGYNTDSYTFFAKAGQTLTTNVTGNVQAYLMNKGMGDSVDLGSEPSYELPVTGTYTIKVGQSRATARQGKTPNYTLQMTIR